MHLHPELSAQSAFQAGLRSCTSGKRKSSLATWPQERPRALRAPLPHRRGLAVKTGTCCTNVGQPLGRAGLAQQPPGSSPQKRLLARRAPGCHLDPGLFRVPSQLCPDRFTNTGLVWTQAFLPGAWDSATCQAGGAYETSPLKHLGR